MWLKGVLAAVPLVLQAGARWSGAATALALRAAWLLSHQLPQNRPALIHTTFPT
jgi:hypothetical protein